MFAASLKKFPQGRYSNWFQEESQAIMWLRFITWQFRGLLRLGSLSLWENIDVSTGKYTSLPWQSAPTQLSRLNTWILGAKTMSTTCCQSFEATLCVMAGMWNSLVSRWSHGPQKNKNNKNKTEKTKLESSSARQTNNICNKNTNIPLTKH